MNEFMRAGKILNAEAKLKSALEDLKQAGCPRSADKVRSAIKSVGGAYRHAQGMAAREEPRNPFLTVPVKYREASPSLEKFIATRTQQIAEDEKYGL